jgi:hypothetical protein
MLQYAHNHVAQNGKSGNETIDFPGYPIYPASEDIYRKSKLDMEINPENPIQCISFQMKIQEL